MKKLIIHIGFPKTATSTLQLNVFTQLMDQDQIVYLSNTPEKNNTLGHISIRKILNYIIGLDKSSDYSDELKYLSKIKHSLCVISNESISHVSETSKDASYKLSADSNAPKIKEIFSPYFDTIEIIMTIRAQKTIIPSYYTQEYFNIINNNVELNDIGEWVNKNFSYHTDENDLLFNYYKMYGTYADVFGAKKIHVLLYEDLVYDKNKYYLQLAKILNLQSEKIKILFESKFENKTVKSKQGDVFTDQKSLKTFLSISFNKLFKVNRNGFIFKTIKIIFYALIPSRLLNTKFGSNVKIRSLSEKELSLINNRFLKS